ncbi:hypothetical protein ALC57_12608 [Trachymyrmex cornetzi]|uniref:Tyr recombinase domain-containing protein n=1 Tax=Trachymyrmex cornetzi TaxID=471704 RepID=A0A195DQD5_9HYME|nr:hypothetical protein ALC57_12608 [Trachymyrmex cornetzi]
MDEPFPGGREIIRRSFQSQTAPPVALDTLIASLSSSTINQYIRPLRDWWKFCQTQKVSTFSPRVDQVLTFLAHELQKAGSYSTLNTSRSAISLISDSNIGNHPMIKRFCKGASILKPQKPRPVGVQTVSRWIRRSLEECGVQSEYFSAHSTRHASTSFAAKNGVSIDLIKRAAGWSGESRVFAKFYNRPIINPDDFSRSVLLS